MTSEIKVKYDALVAEIIDKRNLVLDKGKQDGISIGDEFVVFVLGKEVQAPKTGESLGVLEKIKGKGEVTHIQDRMCTIETYESDIVPDNAFPYNLYMERKKKVYKRFVNVQIGDYARKI